MTVEVLLLICALSVPPEACTAETARHVLVLGRGATGLACLATGQPGLAAGPLLAPDSYARTRCRRAGGRQSGTNR